MISRIKSYLDELLTGNLSSVYDLELNNAISNIANSMISNPNWNDEMYDICYLILRISDILYNNSSIDILPLDDGLYDQLLVKYKMHRPYKVGAEPIVFNESDQKELNTQKILCVSAESDTMYFNAIHDQHIPLGTVLPKPLVIPIREPITKRLVNTTHKYPDLVGTLDKCKFVLNYQAKEAGVFDNNSVQVFERDFMQKCLSNGIITPSEQFKMICELKYDGVSVEAEVKGNTIISALSRGDTSDNIATDLTPILGGYTFPFADKVDKDLIFGIKFEAIITHDNLERLNAARGKEYKNCRNAIIGLFSSSDAYNYAHYITLIPLSTSLDLDRVDEINFLNTFYHSGELNRHIIISGDYQQILFQVNDFTKAAEDIRPILPYMIDGVVISFIDKSKIKALGRSNSINKWSMAIKFNPKKVRTIFTGYTFNIGKSGDIIPMAWFRPCEFIGTIHNKQTIHSYKRFKELNLIKGQQIDIEYVNEVITYVTKPDTEYNRNICGIPEEFIKICPSCGSSLIISESGKTVKCANPRCHEKLIMKMVGMIDSFGFTDFAEESIRILNITSFTDLMNIDYDKLSVLGPLMATKFIDCRNNLLNNPIEDYRLLGAFAFTDIGNEKWKLIFSKYSIVDMLNMHDYSVLTSIQSIGPKTVQCISEEMPMYKDELKYAINILNIINSKDKKQLPKVVISGFRDNNFVTIINNNGYDCSDSYGVTKDTFALIVSDKNNKSSKIIKANKYNIPIYTRDEFISINNIKV